MGKSGEVDTTGSADAAREQTRRRRLRLLVLFLSGSLGLVMLVIGGYGALNFMDSNDFCGRLCHEVMYPEYTTYAASPHGKVDCIECHVGSGASYFVKSKASGIPQIYATIFNTYEKPIPTPVKNLRPARETCEQCHLPQRFSGDFVRLHTTYAQDEDNTEHVDTRVFKVGGGEAGTARDIHWHVAANVWYVALDSNRQNIGWVGVEDADGNVEAYVDPGLIDEVSAKGLGGKRLMDCVDCHNRATHIFYSPDELINMALVAGRIDKDLPYIKREGMQALDPVNPSLEEAVAKVKAIDEFYRTSYADIYSEKPDAIHSAIAELERIARLTTFPDMRVSWTTHEDNLSHQGCFRCHGTLTAVSGSRKGEVVDAGCTLCHYPF